MRFRVTALLDLAVPVNLGQDVVEWLGRGSQHNSFEITIPTLAKGRHCLLVTVLEDAAQLVDARIAPHYSSAMFDLRVNGGEENHCGTGARRDATLRAARIELGACTATLTPSTEEAVVASAVRHGTPVYALLPACPDDIVALFAVDGTPIVTSTVWLPGGPARRGIFLEAPSVPAGQTLWLIAVRLGQQRPSENLPLPIVIQ